MKKVPLFLTVTFAVATVMAVGGAGCSSEHIVVMVEAEAEASVPDTNRPEAVEEDAGPQCPLDTPPPDGSLPWKPPTPPRGDCSSDDYNALDQYLKTNADATTSDVQAFMSKRNETCSACIFTDATKATWGPVPIENGQLLTINIGGCFALVAQSEACGRDIQNVFDCSYDSCAFCSDSEFDSCLTGAQKAICKPFVAKESGDCVSAPSNINDLCGSFIRSVKVQCVADSDAGDAGSDADAN